MQVLVATGLIGLLAAGMASLMSSVFKASKGVDQKANSQLFGSGLRMSVADAARCRVALGLDGTPISIPVASLPVTGTGLPATYTQALSSLQIAGTNYATGTAQQNLKVRSMNLVFSRPVKTNVYPATLQVDFSGSAGLTQNLLQSALIELTMAPDPSNSANMVVSSCLGQNNELEPQSLCETLMGRWLTGEYMPEPRCNMTSDVNLLQNEAPDGIPRDGSQNDEGERIEVCKYQVSSTRNATDTSVKQFNCSSNTRGRGYRCIFDTRTRTWRVDYYSSTNARLSTKYICNKGVKTTSLAPTSMPLAWSDPLAYAYDAETFTVSQENDALPTVSRCKYGAAADLWVNCSNPTTPANALQGKAGSCIYVTNVNLGKIGAAQIKIYNDDETAAATAAGTSPKLINASDYTGWIAVSVARKNVNVKATAASPYNYRIQEALGTPCFTLEVNTPARATEGLPLDASEDAPNTASKEDPSNVVQCEYAAKDKTNFNITRRNHYVCDNSPLDGDTTGKNGPVWDWVGTDGAPQLGIGTCWYVGATVLNGYTAAGLATSSGVYTTSVAKTYTGWVYMSAALPDSKFKPADGSVGHPGDDFAVRSIAPTTLLTAIPCTGGVRKME